MSIIVIIFILYYNSIKLNITTAYILPFSIGKISYWDEFMDSDTFVKIDSDVKKELFYSNTVDEITKLLNSLDSNSNYIASIEYVNDLSIHYLDELKIIQINPECYYQILF